MSGQDELSTGHRLGRRGLSPTMAIVILVVVVVVVGGAGYAGLQSVKPTSSSSTTCTPSTACASKLNDVNLFVAQQPGFGEQYGQLSAGSAFSGTIIPTGSETVKTYTIAWGDGTATTSSGPTITHTYANAGLYVMSASVVDTGGATHTGTSGLFPVNVNQSFGNLSYGTYPGISATFNNGTTGGFEPWATVGTTVTVSASYTGTAPTPGWSNGGMTITAGSGVAQKTYTPGPNSASGTYTLTSAGIANITLHASSVNGATTLPITYTWGVFVAASGTPLGCRYCAPPVAKSPHPGSIIAYEVAPGGAVTLDPAMDYYTVGAEVSLNVYQDLVAYNGTDVGPQYPNYVPQIATCVPGSAQCTALYGNTLQSGHMYTFVIAKTAKFYDPKTKASWNVYPSDVMFSYARQLSFANLPAVAVYAGWIVAQALLPVGNPAWDGGIHAPYNNTPQNIMGAMLVNDSAYCPASAIAGTSGNGCITFNVSGAGQYWPAFLSYTSHGTAGNIVPAGWFTAQGATVPGFGTAGGDFPLLLPGAATSTSQASYQTWFNGLTPTAWDSWQVAVGVGDYPAGEPGVSFNEVGSGPYALTQPANPAIGYVLEANPAFLPPAGCAGQPWCQPAYGNYAKSVTVYWDDDDTAGIQAAQAGQSDYSGIEAADTATLLALVQKGDLKFLQSPATTVFSFGYNTQIDLTSLKTYDPYPINIQSNSLSYIGLRGFLDTAYPYASVQAQFNQIQGIQYGFNYGGFIPQYMGDYYPTNISWPNYNPSTGQFSNPSSDQSAVGSAGWYWKALTTSGNPLYDPQFGPGGYSSSNPMHIPALYFLGDPTHQSVLNLWSSEVSALSGGAVVFDVFPVSSSIVYANLLPNGECPWALWFLGWAADYAQPYDYWAAYGAGSGTWSAADTLFPTFSQSAYNASTCGYSTPSVFANLQHWAAQPYIPQACQGTAYLVTLYWAGYANTNPNLAQGVYEWNQISSVYNLLNLYANTEQTNAQLTVGPWISGATIEASSLNGYPGGELVWYTFTGNGVAG